MTRAEEYRLSQYQHLGALREDKSIDLVRNQQTGLIGVQKMISSELYPVYLFLKEHTESVSSGSFMNVSSWTKIVCLSSKNMKPEKIWKNVWKVV